MHKASMKAFRNAYPEAKVFGISPRKMKQKYARMTFDAYLEFASNRFGKNKRYRDGNGVRWGGVRKWTESITATYICVS